MSHSYIHLHIQDLRARNQQKVLEAIMVGIVALMTVALLPSILVQYFYDVATLTAEPEVLRNIPVVSYILTAGYFLYAVVGNLMREKKIKQLLSQAESVGAPAATSMTDAAISDEELAELEAMVDEVLENSSDEKTSSKKSKAPRKTRTAKKAK